VAHGRAYELSDAPGRVTTAFAPLRDAVRASGELIWPGDGPQTELLCGGYDIASELSAPLQERLPVVLHVSAADGYRRPAVRATLALIADEVQRSEPGAQVVVDRLVDSLLVHVLRAASIALAGHRPACDDREVARVLDMIGGDRGVERCLLEPSKPCGESGSPTRVGDHFSV